MKIFPRDVMTTLVFSKLIFWSKTKGYENEFYKTDQEFADETNLSLSQIKRAKHKIVKLHNLFTIERRGPLAITYYKLNIDVFISKLKELDLIKNYEINNKKQTYDLRPKIDLTKSETSKKRFESELSLHYRTERHTERHIPPPTPQRGERARSCTGGFLQKEGNPEKDACDLEDQKPSERQLTIKQNFIGLDSDHQIKITHQPNNRKASYTHRNAPRNRRKQKDDPYLYFDGLDVPRCKRIAILICEKKILKDEFGEPITKNNEHIAEFLRSGHFNSLPIEFRKAILEYQDETKKQNPKNILVEFAKPLLNSWISTNNITREMNPEFWDSVQNNTVNLLSYRHYIEQEYFHLKSKNRLHELNIPVVA